MTTESLPPSKSSCSFDASKPAAQAIPTISVQELQALYASGAGFTLIDVREPAEYEICALPGAKLMPLRTLPENLATLPQTGQLVVHCHHGGRSAQAVAYLQANGFANAINLAGGIHEWSLKIDPTTPVY